MSARPAPSAFVRPASLADAIYRDLRGRLSRGDIGADDRLVDLDVAKAYGTSRMPAREALLRLQAEGYVAGTTRGFVLPRLTLTDITELFEIRKLLEPEAAARAVPAMTPASLAALGRAAEDARRAVAHGDVDALMEANAAFRGTWLAVCANRRLAETIARFADHVQIVRRATLSVPMTQAFIVDSLAEQARLFADGDPAAVRAAAARFIAEAEASFHRSLSAGGAA